MPRRRRYDPWFRLQRGLTDSLRRDLTLAIEFGQLRFNDGMGREQALFMLNLTEDDAQAAARRIREATRQARIKLEPELELARLLEALER